LLAINSNVNAESHIFRIKDFCSGYFCNNLSVLIKTFSTNPLLIRLLFITLAPIGCTTLAVSVL
jgi:hypothetical protein